jgi:hypothetical protein
MPPKTPCWPWSPSRPAARTARKTAQPIAVTPLSLIIAFFFFFDFFCSCAFTHTRVSLWLLTAEVNNERLAAACSAFFHTRLDDVLHSGYFDSRILDLLPPATVHMLASMPRSAAARRQGRCRRNADRFTDTFNVPPPPPMLVPPPPPLPHASDVVR